MELRESAKHKRHFALYNCLVLGHTKYKGVQQIYCNLFPAEPFYGSHNLDLVMIRPPSVDHGAFVVSPSTVWYAETVAMLWQYSFLQPLLQQTLDPSPTTILRKVIFLIISTIAIMYIIAYHDIAVISIIRVLQDG